MPAHRIDVKRVPDRRRPARPSRRCGRDARVQGLAQTVLRLQAGPARQQRACARDQGVDDLSGLALDDLGSL